MLQNISLNKILFLDVETVSQKPHYEELEPILAELWYDKAKKITRNPEMSEEEASTAYNDRAAIYAEFGKIICISVGLVYEQEGNIFARLKSFYGDDEAKVLDSLIEMLNKYYPSTETHNLCGHNIREFDIPYICRRMLINGRTLPPILNISGKKPWETKYILDTMELWKFGDFKNYTSLKLLSTLFDIPSPKEDLDGSQVGRVYWEDRDLDRIARYCEKDVLAVIQLILRFKNLPLLEEDSIYFQE